MYGLKHAANVGDGCRYRSKKGYSTTNEDKMHKRRHNDLYSDTESEVDAIGASVRGIERYNDIIKHVYKMRQKQEQKDMENTIMREYSTLDGSKKRKRKRDESDLDRSVRSNVLIWEYIRQGRPI